MAFLQQLIDLFSQPPGSTIYHLVTLFTLQAVFGIAYGQWRRDRGDRFLWRTAVAAAALIITRLAIFSAALFLAGSPSRARSLLPPIDQTAHTLTALWLTWALAIPQSRQSTRLQTSLLILGHFVVAVMSLYFIQDWQGRATTGIAYNGDWQVTIWGFLQLTILGLGLASSLSHRALRRSIHPVTLGSLFLAHVIHFWNAPEILQSQSDIAYWIRLGHLIVFPLWAVLIYRHVLRTLMIQHSARVADTTASSPAPAAHQTSPPPPPSAGSAPPDTSLPAPEHEFLRQLQVLEDERDRLSRQVEVAEARRRQAEEESVVARQQARHLAETLDEIERLGTNETVAMLEAEIGALRESLQHAEESMALAAAGEIGLSTAWLMRTITHYSGQLEEAEARIEKLETELVRRERGLQDEVVASIAEELRTPMTSIVGFIDLLLAESVGTLGARQRDFLHRVKANIERMGALVDQIIRLATVESRPESPVQIKADVRDVIDVAVNSVINQIREKNLRLDLDIDEDLPVLPVDRLALHQIVANLLSNACASSAANGHMAISARQYAQPGHLSRGQNGDDGLINFVSLKVSDSGGGIPVEDRARVFKPQHRTDSALISGLGDTSAGLAVARSLAEEHGGRMWVNGEIGVGSVFTVLFPVVADGAPLEPKSRETTEL